MNCDELRERMVREQLQARGLSDERLLAAFRRVPRHRFVPAEYQAQAYEDHPLPIGENQTISQPYIVALMINCLRLQGHERVLEIGTGSGYETAVLSELALEVYSVERVPALLVAAKARLAELGYQNVRLSPGNGTLGWPGHAPYDAILVSAGAPGIPGPLLTQLADPGRMVLPVGPADAQMLTEVDKRDGRVTRQDVGACVFVPLVGEHGWQSRND
jgi:protein-L-isoaspartate(D-aspartate) O-methyltransferase